MGYASAIVFLQINVGSGLNWPFLYFGVENLLFVTWDPIYVIVYPICDFCFILKYQSVICIGS